MSPPSTAQVKQLRAFDQHLQDRFARTFPQLKRRSAWRNREVKRYASQAAAGVAGLAKFTRVAATKGLFEIRFERRRWVDSDGERRSFTLARAASTDMFPMGTHFWLRDNTIIGARFLRSRDPRQQRRGKELLLSCLTFISSVAQRRRFEAIIRSRSAKFVHDVDNWPRVFPAIADNLTTQKHEGWSHKQDAWQMLAWYVLEALEDGRISDSDLTEKHRHFLGLVVPFLTKVSFWKCENSGSWEEIAAIRTSVRAWEHRLVVRISELASTPQYRYLSAGYSRQRRYLGSRFSKTDLHGAVRILDREASRVMLTDLPFESPMYLPRDARFRRGDAALIYLLELDYVAFLGARTGRSLAWIERMEERLLQEVVALQDERSGGLYRYRRDTYQRCGYFRALTTAKLVEAFGAPSGDASKDFLLRGRLVPQGRQAAWTHFVWQLAAWAGERFLATKEARYATLSTRFFTQGLALITGAEGSMDLDAQGQSRIVRIAPWRMPECYIADVSNDGVEMVFPSPHTPLNWAVVEMINAFRVREDILRLREKKKKKMN